MSGNPEAHDYEGAVADRPPLQPTASLVDRIRLARAGMAVERCHVLAHALRYSVGQHTGDLVALIILTWQAAHGGRLPSAALLCAATFHDVPERVVGDIPSPTKALLGSKLDAVETNVLVHLGVNVGLTPEERAWLDACDRLELSLWALEEAYQRGSHAVASWVVPDSASTWPMELKALLGDLLKRVDKGTYDALSWQELKEVAGL